MPRSTRPPRTWPGQPDGEVLPFEPWGGDERQFCSPGFDLPVGALTRSPRGPVPGLPQLRRRPRLRRVPSSSPTPSDRCLEIIDILETNARYRNLNPKGEPQLGKRGLYRSVARRRRAAEKALLWVLNQSDGEHSLLDISDRSGLRLRRGPGGCRRSPRARPARGAESRVSELEGQVAVVTGGGRGIGRVSHGRWPPPEQRSPSLGRTDRDLKETAAEIERANGRSLALAADVTREDQVAAAMNQIERDLGPIDLLVNNAGSLRCHRPGLGGRPGPLVARRRGQSSRNVHLLASRPAGHARTAGRQDHQLLDLRDDPAGPLPIGLRERQARRAPFHGLTCSRTRRAGRGRLRNDARNGAHPDDRQPRRGRPPRGDWPVDWPDPRPERFSRRSAPAKSCRLPRLRAGGCACRTLSAPARRRR